MPVLIAKNSPRDAGLVIAQSIAIAISLTFIKGLHGVPSLRMVICLDANAQATKSFKTRSKRSRELMPHAVANRRQVTVKFLSAKGFKSCSVRTLERA